MKQFRFKILLIVGFIGLSLYLLYPTYQDNQNNKEISEKLEIIKDSLQTANPDMTEQELNTLLNIEENILQSQEAYKDAREKRMKLGLDLQGGMYLVMEVNTAKLLERIAKEPDDRFHTLLKAAEQESKLSDENVVSILTDKLQEQGIRLSRYFGSIKQDDGEIVDELETQESDAVSRAIEIISNRVNQYGVSEPSIQKQGSRRIIVELPGISREEEAKQLLQGRALLEFRMVKDPEFTFPIMTAVDGVMKKIITNDTKADTTQPDSLDYENMSEEERFQQNPFFFLARLPRDAQYADAFVEEKDMQKLENYLSLPEVQNVIPDNVEFLFSAKPIYTENQINYFKLYMINKSSELTGEVITDAQANIDQSTTAPIVTMQMNTEGSIEWARITGSNVGKRVAVVLDGVVYTAPVIRGKIPTGNTQIEGMEDLEEAKLLEIILKAGALPAPVDIIEERTVGPSLGQDSINQGLTSTVAGLLLVIIFMVFYYKKAGTIADLALVSTVLLLMGVLAGFQATLTLPGIAGIILTIGMAVDANVLIFERIREELATGKTAKAAIESGYLNSYSAIFDSNITTFFTAIILYQFGSGPIQGFALTLMIGIVVSLFSALVVTRLIFDIMLTKGTKVNVG
ncbi:MAG: protein translocase subunit SecD [Melioribacteraceae bacterium]|nr:MAG: protein translocase subunit SecD [Melioribacteraceae bacterium]